MKKNKMAGRNSRVSLYHRIMSFLCLILISVSFIPVRADNAKESEAIRSVNENADEKYLMPEALSGNTKQALGMERLHNSGKTGVKPPLYNLTQQEPVSIDGQTIEKVLVRWLTPSTGETEPAGYGRLSLKASDNNTISNQQFQIDIALSGQFDYAAGEVELVFPAYLWLDRNGKEPSELTLGVPEEPDLSQDFSYKRVGDKILVTNIRRIPSGTKFLIQGTFRNMDPSSMIDKDVVSDPGTYAGYSDDFYAVLTIVSSKGNTASMESNHIDASYDTGVHVVSSVKTAHNPSGEKYEEYVYDKVPEHMPKELVPENPDDYMYIRWYVSGSAAGSQPFDMIIREDLSDDPWEGMICGFEKNGEVTEIMGKTAEYLIAGNCTDFGISKSCYVWTAYPKEKFERTDEASSKIQNTQTTLVTGIDDRISTEMSSSDTADYRIPITYTWNKIWNDEEDLHHVRPDRVILKIFRQPPDDTEWDMKHPWKTVNVTEDSQWSFSWSDGGIPFTYRVQEQLVNASGVYRTEYDAHGNARYLKWDYVLDSTDYDLAAHTWNYINRYTEGWVEFEVSNIQKTVKSEAYKDKDRKSVKDNALNSLKKGKPVLAEFRLSSSVSVAEDTVWFQHKPMTVQLMDGEYAFGNVILSPGDAEIRYIRIPEVKTYAYTNLNENTGKYQKTPSDENQTVYIYGLSEDQWIRYASFPEKQSSGIVTENGAYISGERLYFPEGVFQIKAEKETEEAVVEISMDVGLLLKPSDTVTERVLSEFRTTDYGMLKLENKARMSAEYRGETTVYMEEAAAAFLHGRNYRVAAELDKSMEFRENDPVNRRILLDASVTLRQQTNVPEISEYRQAKETALAGTEKGIFYDLLPSGMAVDTDSVSIDNGRVTYVRTIPDYRGSGRTLLKVYTELDLNPQFMKDRDSDPSNPHYRDESYPKTGCYEEHTLSFSLVYPWDEASERGLLDIVNYASYEASESVFGDISGWSGEADDVSGANHQETGRMVSGAEEYLINLDPERDDPAFVYANARIDLDEIDLSALVSVSVSVRTDGSARWTYGLADDANVYEGQGYTYRLQMVNDHETISRNIVLLNSLEAFVPSETDADFGDARWKGRFSSLDLSQLKAMNIKPKVYYYVGPTPDLSVYNPGQESGTLIEKLEEDPQWVNELPDDPEAVTAIAVDCSKTEDGQDFELQEDGILQIYIHMKAPFLDEESEVFGDDPSDPAGNGHAYNQVYLDVDQKTNGQLTHGYIHFDYTKVGIRSGSIKVRKVWDDMDDNDGIRPSTIEIGLFVNGEDTGKQLILEDTWEGVFDRVRLYDETGCPVKVELKEEVPDGYVCRLKREKEDTYTLINIHEPERISVPFTKEWVGDEMPDGSLKRPESITVYLDADGVYTGRSLRVTQDTDYSGVFENMLKYRNKEEVHYQLREAPVEGFYVSYEENRIINTYYPYADLVVEKTTEDATEKALENHFTFIAEFFTENNEEVTEAFSYETSDGRTGQIINGSEFTIRAGESFRIKDIPLKTRYRITEKNLPGFTLTEKDHDTGTISESKKEVSVIFNNTYNSTGSVSLTAVKVLNGRELKPYQFSFIICDENLNPVRKAFVSSDGMARFSPIRFTQKDDGTEFTYYVSEVVRDLPGYIFDPEIYTVKIIPHDNGDGTMSVDSHCYNKNGAETEQLLFINEYRSEGNISLKAWKKLSGRELLEGEFSFELLNEEGIILETRENNRDGSILFSPLTFTQDDAGKTFHYFVREKQEEDEGIIYDDSVYCYEITVEDNADGTLSISQSMRDPLDYSKELNILPVFENTLKPGSLALQKGIRNNQNTDTGQEFNFKVIFTGEGMKDASVTYERYHYELAEEINEKIPDSGSELHTLEINPLKASKMQLQSVNGTPVLSADLSGYPEENAQITSSGIFGSCIYEIWSDGTLLIYPENGTEGQLGNTKGRSIATGFSSDAPWYEKKDEITRVIIREGVKTGTSCEALFAGLNSVTDMDLSNLDTSEATNMNYMFCMDQAGASKRSKLTELDLSGFDTSRVTSMAYMFHQCWNLRSLDISSFDTSSVTDMNHMFFYCYYLQSLDVSSFNTINVTDMSYMFYYNYSIKALDLSDFNTSKVTNMYSMFYQDTQLKTLDLSSFDTSNVTDMRFMFLNNLALQNLDLSSFNTSNVLKMNNMFDNCRSLTRLDLSNFDTSKVTDMFKMFYQCCKLEYLNISSFDMTHLTRKKNMLDMKLSGSATGRLTTLVLGEKCILEETGLRRIDEMDSIYRPEIHTGKWVLEENEDMALTSGELMSFYDGYSGINGTWVWETYPTTYKVTFLAGESGALGSMPSQRFEADQDARIVNEFSCFSSEFTGFTDGEKEFMSYDGILVTIPANTYQKGETVTLIPMFSPKQYETELSNGELTVSLHGNEQIVFKDLPAGIFYHIYEETPDGWMLVYQENSSGTIESLQTKEAVFVNEYQPGSTGLKLHALKLFNGIPSEENSFRFVLHEDGTVKETVPVGENGVVSFSEIVYTSEGEHHYSISEIIDGISGIQYDEHVENITVIVKDNGKGELVKETEGNLFPVFNNYKKPGNLIIKKEAEGLTKANRNTVFSINARLLYSDGKPYEKEISYEIYDSQGQLIRTHETVPESGIISFELRADESVFIKDLPDGILYSVDENDTNPGWSLKEIVSKEGIIAAGGSASVTVRNRYEATGSITLKAYKKLLNNHLESGRFRFRIFCDQQLIDEQMNGSEDIREYISDDEGNPVPNPTYGMNSIVFTPITFNEEGSFTYTIQEVNTEEDGIIYDDHIEEITVLVTDSGLGYLKTELVTDEDGPLFVNSPAYAQLSVNKTVEGSMGNRTEDFHFKLKLSNDSGALKDQAEFIKILQDGTVIEDSIRGKVFRQDETNENRTGIEYEFSLKHGETIRFTKIPVSSYYEVTEKEADQGGYETHSVYSSGSVEKDVVCSFTNKREGAVPAGITQDYSGLRYLFVVSGLVLALFFLEKGRRKLTD